VISTSIFTLGVIGMTFRSDSIGGGGMLVPMGPLEIMEPQEVVVLVLPLVGIQLNYIQFFEKLLEGSN